jgi:hypothetical protein
MATRFTEQGGALASPDLATVLAALPSLPRPVLARLTARLIDRLDEIDGDPDLEDYEGSHRVDEKGRILPDTPDTPALRDDDEDGADAECETWPTFGSQWSAAA